MLPKKDGYMVCRMLKFGERYKKIPMVMLTARAQEKDEDLGYEVGANCLIKNVTERLIKNGSLTHNGCYRITNPRRRVDHESTVEKRIYRSYLFTL
jgi:CheY-like chemotaxis protein